MLCPTCEKSVTAAFLATIKRYPQFDYQTSRLSRFSNDDEIELTFGSDHAHILQKDARSLNKGSVAGCFICRSIITHDKIRAGLNQNNVSMPKPSSDLFPIKAEVAFFRQSPPHLEIVSPVQYDPLLNLTLSPISAKESRAIYRSLLPLSGYPSSRESPVGQYTLSHYITRTLQTLKSIYSYPKRSPVEIPVCTSGAVGIWRQWYDTCTKSHVLCQRTESRLSPFKPSRLIEILKPEGPESTDLRWRLVLATTIPHVPYVTLSHCWGTSQHAILTKSNFPSLVRDISHSASLPKTYRDALIVADSLGFNHIWIDSLCIIQDDQADWLFESSLMDKVYNTSSCNIAATWADDGTGGCFIERDSVLAGLTTVAVPFNNGEFIEYQLGNADARKKDVDNAPLNTRAWVFQ
ncbi:Heterokaryon incompatibility protein (HET) domain containing protein [Naviculisporaceae sp. PSN 640]